MVTKTFKTLKLDDIIPYENNPRINDEAVADVGLVIKVLKYDKCEPTYQGIMYRKIRRWVSRLEGNNEANPV